MTEKNEKEILEEASESGNSIPITKDLILAIGRIKDLKTSLELTKKELADELDAVAKKLNVKKAVLQSRIELIIREETKGGVVKSKKEDIEFTQKYFEVKDNL